MGVAAVKRRAGQLDELPCNIASVETQLVASCGVSCPFTPASSAYRDRSGGQSWTCRKGAQQLATAVRERPVRHGGCSCCVGLCSGRANETWGRSLPLSLAFRRRQTSGLPTPIIPIPTSHKHNSLAGLPSSSSPLVLLFLARASSDLPRHLVDPSDCPASP